MYAHEVRIHMLVILRRMKRSTNTVVDLKDKQLEILALINSWVFSRLVAENERAGESLASMMDAVAEAEGEQGRSLLSRFLLPCLPGTHAPHSHSVSVSFPSPSFACDSDTFFVS
jgi:hypothetical protein